MNKKGAPSRSNHQVFPELEELAEQVGIFIQYWGFKQIHGKIWTHLYLSQDPLDAGELIGRLQVSKALVSLSLKDLLEYNVVLDSGKSSRGTTLYDANPRVMDVILTVLRKREKRMLSHIDAAYRMVNGLAAGDKANHRISSNRLESLGDMISEAQGTLDAILVLNQLNLERWRRFNEDEQE